MRLTPNLGSFARTSKMNSKELAKEERTKLKAEFKAMKNKIHAKRITKTKVDSLRKTNKIDKSPSKLIKRMSQIHNIRHEKRNYYRHKRCCLILLLCYYGS